jgi:NAD(P)-dependent dehydrogenase (short-subunit alcohol dehydrogenase family)
VARTQEQLDEVAMKIRQGGGDAVVAPGDVTDETFVERLFDTVRVAPGRLDILVNSAGVAPFGPIETLPSAMLRECLEINVVAAYSFMQQAIRLMNETGGAGKIVNIGSVRSHWTEAGDAGAYNASKFAIRALTESVARQLHGSGSRIAVSLVCPGVVDTTLTNPTGEPRPGWLRPITVAQAVLHAVTAPDGVNVFDTTLFPTEQRPW